MNKAMCLTVACAVIDLKGHFDLVLLRFCLATVVLMPFVAFSLDWLISVRLVTV